MFVYTHTHSWHTYIRVPTCRCSVFSTVWFTLQVFMELRTMKKMANGPVGRSWNNAFCYGLPVLYKLFWLLLIVNDSTPVFTYYSTIMCIYHRVLSEILIVLPAYGGSSFSVYCMIPKVVKIRKAETCIYGEGCWSLTTVHNNNNNNNNNNNTNILYNYSHYYVFG